MRINITVKNVPIKNKIFEANNILNDFDGKDLSSMCMKENFFF